MERKELEHIIRAAGEIAQVKKIIILGSQSILAQYPEISKKRSDMDYQKISFLAQNYEILHRSMEADVMIPDSAEKTELVEGVMGELSLFHGTFGYYAQGVDLTTSKLPEGWEDRLVEICNENTNDVSGMCLEIHDLIVSKLYAGRKKDIEFFKAAVNSNLLSMQILTERLTSTSMTDESRIRIENYIKSAFRK